jgi:toxin secretion/phage lysis holin
MDYSGNLKGENMDKITSLKSGLAIVGGAIGGIFGGWDMGLKVLFAMVIIDYLTGMIASGYQGKLSSSIGMKGIIKKVMIFVVVYIGVLLDGVLGSTITIFEFDATIRMAVIFFYIANEGISILENMDRMEVALPSFLRSLLQQMRDRADKEEV